MVYPFLLKGKPCPVSVPSRRRDGVERKDQVRDLIENTILFLSSKWLVEAPKTLRPSISSKLSPTLGYRANQKGRSRKKEVKKMKGLILSHSFRELPA